MRSRIADALLYTKDIFGISEKNGALDVELKRSEYAAMSNMTESNAIRTISEFQKSGIIKVSGRKIKILRMELLQKISLQGF
jgi:CRP-like cAMP-binding protein